MTTVPAVTSTPRALFVSAAAALLLPAIAAAGPAHAADVYLESISGDLSNSGLTPTSLVFAVGDNRVFGSTGRGTDGVVDRDYFTFTLLSDTQLIGLEVLPGTTSIGPATVSFLGLQAGSQVTVNPALPTATELLGWRHYGPNDIGSNILPQVGTGAGAQGFAGPLGPGTYSVWLQETGTGSANYGFNFLVASVPEPASWAMMLVGFGALGAALRSRRRPSRRACIRA